MATIGTWICGAYTASWSSTSVGVTKNGWELELQYKQEAIDETDVYGASTLDLIYRGIDALMSATLREWKAGSTAPLWQVGGGVLGKTVSAAVPIGVLGTTLAQAFVLTSTAATPAVAAPATLTIAAAIFAPSFNPRIIFDSRLREIPLKLMALPQNSAGVITLFSTT